MDVGGAQIDTGAVAHILRQDAPTHTVARLEHHRFDAALLKPACGSETGGARAHNDHTGLGPRGPDLAEGVGHVAVGTRRQHGRTGMRPVRRADFVNPPLLRRAET